jgi:hypothetical protein
MIERNVDLTSRDVARSAPDGLTLRDAQRPERTRAEPPFCMGIGLMLVEPMSIHNWRFGGSFARRSPAWPGRQSSRLLCLWLR